jgi:glutamate 5-kinase
MTLVVKLGSSIVAADDGELRVDVLDSVCAQVGELQQRGERVVMVTSGAIARGMRLLGISQRPTAMDELQATSAVGQGDLFKAYEQRLRSHGLRAAQILLSASDISIRANYVNARHTIDRLLRWGIVPIVNENDTTATDEITFGDNDFLAAQLAVLLRARLLVLLTDTDGVFDMHPAAEGARMIREISDPSHLDEIQIGEETSQFGRGGMGRKVAAAEIASQSGLPTVICNGTVPGTLVRAVEQGDVGTVFKPHQGKTPAFKLWLKHAKAPRGGVHVDPGAALRLRESGASLLPVGIREVTGSFQPGDAVLVYDRERRELLGKGITEYSARDLRGIAGLKSDEVRRRFPDAADEVIHRDRFVLL